jgi:uncharacterized protein YndB with AHSA1/START domain
MWRKVLLGALGAVLLAVLGLLAIASQKPDSFEVKRSIDISAPSEKVYGLVDDFHAWGAWSPWDKLDPGMKRTYEGAPRGVGAVYEWSGNDKVGSGRMEITKATAPTSIELALHFLTPFEAKNTTTFAFAPQGTGTQVTWSMTGENKFIGKVMSVFMDMDALIGGDFEKGLRSMKQAAEAN